MSRSPAARPLGALAALLVLSLAGGAWASSPAPASDPTGFRYDPLPASGSVDFRIDAASPVFEFQTGRSAYRAFRLPDAGSHYTVDVRSFVEGPTDPARARVFYPVVATLSDDFLVTRNTDPEALRFDLPVFEDADAPSYRVTLGSAPPEARERYLIVYTAAALLASRSLPPVTTPEAAVQAARVSFVGASPYGRLRITVRAEDFSTTPAGPRDLP